jgi:hypothetical protein
VAEAEASSYQGLTDGQPGLEPMTEREWQASDNPERMLAGLPQQPHVRKLRLLVCACLRSPGIWPLLTSRSSRRAVEASERFADGLATTEEMKRVRTSAHIAWASSGPVARARFAAAGLAQDSCWLDAMLQREGVNQLRRFLMVSSLLLPPVLIRDVLGNPFRPVAVARAVITPTVKTLAQAAYDERTLPSGELDAVRLAVLADALEEAGAGGEVVEHLRNEGPHVRGCWAVDALTRRA